MLLVVIRAMHDLSVSPPHKIENKNALLLLPARYKSVCLFICENVKFFTSSQKVYFVFLARKQLNIYNFSFKVYQVYHILRQASNYSENVKNLY